MPGRFEIERLLIPVSSSTDRANARSKTLRDVPIPPTKTPLSHEAAG